MNLIKVPVHKTQSCLILVIYMSPILTSPFSLVCLLFLWLLSVQCPLFLLWIYGNNNPVTHLRHFMKFNPYLSLKQADILVSLITT